MARPSRSPNRIDRFRLPAHAAPELPRAAIDLDLRCAGSFEGGRAVETNFHAYPLLRLHEAPARIDVHFVDRPDAQISGLGESALPPVAPALANALYRATGHRLRELPLRLPA